MVKNAGVADVDVNAFKRLVYISFQNSNMSGAPLTPDQENFWRLIHILWDDVPRMLRVFFKSKYHQRFNIAWGDNQPSGEFFTANFPNSNKRHMGQHIIALLDRVTLRSMIARLCLRVCCTLELGFCIQSLGHYLARGHHLLKIVNVSMNCGRCEMSWPTPLQHLYRVQPST